MTVVDLFITVMAIAGTFCTLIGMLTIVYWIKPSKDPADNSNRINNISSWWIGMTRPEVLAKSYKYFRQDVMDNVRDVDRSEDPYP